MNETEKFNILRTATDITFPTWGAWLFDTWASHNETYFDGQLSVVPIYFGLIAHGHALGLYEHGRYSRITIHQSLLEPAQDSDPWKILDLLGERFASDVLLHEMIHQKIHETYGHDGSELGGNSSHNNPVWCDEITRLSSMIGLGTIKAEVIKRKRLPDPKTGKKGKPVWFVEDGYLSRDEISRWPWSITSEAYYMNESHSRSL